MFASDDSAVALSKISEGLDELLSTGVRPNDCRAAVEVIRAVEVVGRKLAAVQAELVDVIDHEVLFAADGHASARVMVRHVAKLSGGEASARANTAAVVRDLPEAADRFRSGDLGVDQIRLLGRIHANRRVRPHMAEAETWFLRVADRLTFPDYEIAARQWERLADTKGPEPRSIAERNVSFTQNRIDLSWKLDGSMPSLTGAGVVEIFEHYINAELLADWEKAKADKGTEAAASDLARTAAQRRADALWQIFQDAAHNPNSAVPVGFCHNLVWNEEGYEQMLARVVGADPSPIDPDTFRCTTIDGIPVNPYEAAANSLVEHMRRVVVNSAGVVIDQGRARVFTGSARLAVLLADNRCTHPGCWVPASQCQIDHTISHASRGRTNPGNGGPRCQKHNLFKEQGFTVWRDPAGQWHTHRPDGTEID